MTDQPRITVAPPPRPKVTPYKCDTGRPVCGKPARLYAVGWRCDIHNPAAWAARQAASETRPDTERTTA